MAFSAFWLLALLPIPSPGQHGPGVMERTAAASEGLLASLAAEEFFEHEVAEEDFDDQALPCRPHSLVKELGAASHLLDPQQAPRPRIRADWHHSQRGPPAF